MAWPARPFRLCGPLLWRVAVVLAAASPVAADALKMPATASLQAQRVTPSDSYDMPVGPWMAGTIPTVTLRGAVSRQAWRIAAPGLTTEQVIAPLRAQLQAKGYEVVFECRDDACGGFDFRFGTEVLAAPAMQVDFMNYRFLAARRTDDPEQAVSVIASTTAREAYVQIVTVGAAADTAATAAAPATDSGAAPPVPVGVPASAPTDLATRLEREGHVVLAGLSFDAGAASLGPGQFPVLQELADYLVAHPGRDVVLVGHTDASGSLTANVALSQKRAAAVMARLVSDYGVSPGQLDAQGVGYLAPLASNLTQAGRDANRRVEAVLISTN
ncbi:MAG: OmpA family protein [Limimaricola sp.]|uniref:OmpA family protein n=1 Tax=Limimaricola sp. TaxID=2211665 RepID=UPI001D841937|nr:OmpA family protein [Limimaricola sp.]MBI1418756.1 OmpA family protein [Limimaricola sp.]